MCCTSAYDWLCAVGPAVESSVDHASWCDVKHSADFGELGESFVEDPDKFGQVADSGAASEVKYPAELWDVRRNADGSIDALGERKRCLQLVALANLQPIGMGNKRRLPDVRFSFEPVNSSAVVPQSSLALTSLDPSAFERHLTKCPDRLAVALLLDTLRNGANLCYNGPRTDPVESTNHSLTTEQAAFLEKELISDLEKGRSQGWFNSRPFPNAHVSAMGVVDKNDMGRPVGLRRICNLSDSPLEAVNSCIERLRCECSSFDSVLEAIATLSQTSDIYMFHLDVKGAFRLIPVRAQDWHLQVFKWKGRYLFDLVLVFGCRTSPPIWRRVGSALEYIFSLLPRLTVKHHVDDFLFLVAVDRGKPPALHDAKSVSVAVAGSTERKQIGIQPNTPKVAVDSFVNVLDVGAELGVPWSWEKTKIPTQLLIHLGIGLDTSAMTAFVPPARLSHTLDVIGTFIAEAEAKGGTTRPVLQSLIGKLSFVCRVFPPGRCFLNRLLSLLRIFGDAPSIPVEAWLLADLYWWQASLPKWKGISAIPRSLFEEFADETFGTDACQDGYGGHWQGSYFSEAWTAEHRQAAQRVLRYSMPWMELYAVAAAVALWSKHWSGKRVLVKVDCEPVAYWINKGNTTRDQTVDLLRSIADCCVTYKFELAAKWVAGQTNTLADLLSRLHVDRFLQALPTSSPSGRVKPPGFMTVLSASGRLC